MKHRIVVSALAILLGISAKAQPAEYLHTTNLHSYEGIWEYTSGDETFTLVIKRGQLNTTLFYGECLIGGYYHFKNGQVRDYTRNIPNRVEGFEFSRPSRPIFIGENGCVRPDCVTPNEVDFYFWDENFMNNKSLKGMFTLIDSHTARFEVWKMEDISGRPSGEITIPQDVIMKKVYWASYIPGLR